MSKSKITNSQKSCNSEYKVEIDSLFRCFSNSRRAFSEKHKNELLSSSHT